MISKERDSLKKILSAIEHAPGVVAPATAQNAVHLARLLQRRANELQTPHERRQQAELDRMVHNPEDKATLMQMTDQAFRSEASARAIDQLVHILDVQGVPRFFSPWDRTLLKGFQTFGGYLPGVVAPFVKQKMRQETANVVLPAEKEMLIEHLQARQREGVRMNVNLLGESILGEDEAASRLKSYLQALQLPEIEVVSVKISTIYSQISRVAKDETLSVLADRLELLYRAASKGRFTRADGTVTPKFVYLDMEEYRDMVPTAEAFMRTLDRKGLEDTSAGIVLQAYIPDSYRMQKRINAWARDRRARGGAPITLRIVKGANMEMERVEASLHGWPQAPFKKKIETDANYKRMLHEALLPENIAAVRVGVASHNLFELAYGVALAFENNALDRVQFEMLEGMANHQRRALFELTRDMLLYAPACRKKDFIHAIGYLVRRMDENTGPENFLRHAFKLEVDSDDWRMLEQGFLESFDQIATLPETPRRTQDRRIESPIISEANTAASDSHTANGDAPSRSDTRTVSSLAEFRNEPDTDFALPQNVEWAEEIVKHWLAKTSDCPIEIPLFIDGEQVTAERTTRASADPSRPGHVVARYSEATREDVDAAVACAQRDPANWRGMDANARRGVLRRVANELRATRASLIGAAMMDGGKTVLESDPEVSEAIDFVEFYALMGVEFDNLRGTNARGKGVVVVVSPWNFPIAIPCGGVAAALAAGNTVILKPASDTVLTAHELCACFWRAGVSREALQLLPCPGGDAGAYLVGHDDVDVVILTGGTETALRMLDAKPGMRLLAETGGKNATIVTALADRDQAIKHVIHSAFGHAGQKCSATSLLILESEVYHDKDFERVLCDAARSLRVGPAHDLATSIGPLIRPPSGDLERALKELEPGESWALMPKHGGDNPNLYTPGIKWGVRPDSYTHTTEFFGPVLGVMEARNLDDAIDLANRTGFGLTSGLESLDDREQALWKASIRAGNLYVNRGTTGAIVLRQPFGGMGKSAFGPGIKAGGPNYVAQLIDFDDVGDSDGQDIIDSMIAEVLELLQENAARNTLDNVVISSDEGDSLTTAARSYARYFREEFSKEHDHFRLVGQDNLRRYLPLPEVCVRVDPDDTLFDIVARVLAARTAGCRVTVSVSTESSHSDAHAVVRMLDALTTSWAAAIEFVEESDEGLAARIRARHTHRVRYAAADRVPRVVRVAASEVQLYIADAPVSRNGRIELLWYFEEQSVSVDYHRYGNLGGRVGEARAAIL